MIEIDLGLFTKVERGTHVERVKVTRGGKTFYREQRVGVKPSRKDTGKIASLPEDMKKEILELRRLGDSGAKIKSQIENMIDASDDPKIKDDLAAKGILKSSSGAASLIITSQSLVDWAKARGVESAKKRKTVKEVEAKSKEELDRQFKEANEKLVRLKVENQELAAQITFERKSKDESDKIRSQLRNENLVLREKLKAIEAKE